LKSRFFTFDTFKTPTPSDGVEDNIWSSFFRSLLPVGLTYSAALLGIEFGLSTEIEIDRNNLNGALGLLIVPLFTATHCVFPVFFYFIFAAVIMAIKGEMKKESNIGAKLFFLVFSGFVFLHMGFWFGIPTIALAFFTGWLTIPLALVHIALSKKGTRTFVFLEYGSTSFALLLFFMLFSVEDIFPLGIIVAMLQILLLTLVDWKGRPLWLKLAAAASEKSETQQAI